MNNFLSKTYRLSAALVLCMYLQMSVVFPVAYAFSFSTALDVYAANTVAGTSTMVRTSQTDPQKNIIIEVKKPDGNILTLPIMTDETGYGKIALDSYHIQSTGTYQLRAYEPGRDTDGKISTFVVYADKPSMALSSVKASTYMASSNGNDAIDVQVQLRDAYNNPVENQQVKLISSRAEDIILAQGDTITNSMGTVLFKVSSLEAGMSTLSAINLSTNEILNDRIQVLFEQGLGKGGSMNTLATNYFGASLLAETSTSTGSSTNTTSSIATKLKLTTVPSSGIKTGELFDVVVEVLTASGDPALDYRGTIVFTSDDTNAVLPTAYTFTGGEQPAAKKTFAKAARFITDGTKVLEVKDSSNSSLKDVITVSNTAIAGNTGITLTSPQAGVITTKDMIITGKGPALSMIKIFDANDQVGVTTADAQGAFQTTISTLTDGTHIISAKAYDTASQIIAVSSPVSIVMQSSGAWVKSLSLDPVLQQYTVGQSVNITMSSEPGLLEAFFVVDGVKFALRENPMQAGIYTGQVTLPTKEGSYDTTVQLKNKLGVAGTVPSSTPIMVKAPTFPMDTVNFVLDGDTKVKASWTQPTIAAGISSYRIYYGLDAMNLKDYQTVVYTANTHQFVGLTPNTTYYFKFVVMGQGENVLLEGPVKALTTPDTLQIKNAVASAFEGKIKVIWEMAASSVPVSSFKILYGTAPKNYIKEIAVKDTLEIVFDPLVQAKPHYMVIQGLGADGRPVVQSEEISVTPSEVKPAAGGQCVPGDVQNLHVVLRDKQKYLVWDAAVKAEKYRIHAGTEQGYYNLPVVEVTGTEYKIPMFDTKLPAYYFAVTALCGEGESLSFSNAVKVQTGPIAFLLFTGAVGVGIYMRYIRGREVKIY